MLDEQARAFFESGCGLVVGLADADRRPYAQRGWGARVVDGRLRVVVSGDDRHLAELATPGAGIAVTGADVRTLRGLQAKGHVVALGPEAPADHAHMLRHCDEFFDAIVELDGIPRPLLERMRPVTYAVCEIDVEALFDQTPGPGAGRSAVEQQA
jgi:hypothetical protein